MDYDFIAKNKMQKSVATMQIHFYSEKQDEKLDEYGNLNFVAKINCRKNANCCKTISTVEVIVANNLHIYCKLLAHRFAFLHFISA